MYNAWVLDLKPQPAQVVAHVVTQDADKFGVAVRALRAAFAAVQYTIAVELGMIGSAAAVSMQPDLDEQRRMGVRA